MNKNLFLGVLAAVLLIMPAVSAAAVTNIQSLMATIAGSVLWSVFGAIVVVCFVYAGILFLSASGDATKLAAARSSFLWGVVGVVVGIIAYSIINVIENVLS